MKVKAKYQMIEQTDYDVVVQRLKILRANIQTMQRMLNAQKRQIEEISQVLGE